MSPSLSASRTCSGPELMSTMRPAGATIDGRNVDAAGSTGAEAGSAAVPVITRPTSGRAEPSRAASGNAALGTASASFLARFVRAAPWHGVEFQAVADQLVA